MHYTGMAAATYVYTPGQAVTVATSQTMDSGQAVTGCIVASMIFLWIVILLVLADVRSWFYRAANTVRTADKLVHYIEKEMVLTANTSKLLQKYKSLRHDIKVRGGGCKKCVCVCVCVCVLGVALLLIVASSAPRRRQAPTCRTTTASRRTLSKAA